jgi:hypothetical protein
MRLAIRGAGQRELANRDASVTPWRRRSGLTPTITAMLTAHAVRHSGSFCVRLADGLPHGWRTE